MDLPDIEAVLEAALPLRSPVFQPGDTARKKIGELEDYMLKTAHVTGGLVEAKHWLAAVEERLSEEWDALQGWEVALKRPRAKATKQEITVAKMQSAPQLYEAGRKARRLRVSVVDQITRLEREGDRMSRAYTMLSGG